MGMLKLPVLSQAQMARQIKQISVMLILIFTALKRCGSQRKPTRISTYRAAALILAVLSIPLVQVASRKG